MVKYSSFENHWVLWPMVTADDGYYYDVTASAFTAYGPEVKAGEKIVSITYEVIKETKVSDLDFHLLSFSFMTTKIIITIMIIHTFLMM